MSKKTVAFLIAMLTALVFIPSPKHVNEVASMSPQVHSVSVALPTRSGEDIVPYTEPQKPQPKKVVNIKPVPKPQAKTVIIHRQRPIPDPVSQPQYKTGWMDFQATFYTLNQGSGTGRTATGTIPTVGRTLAVDPSIIPLGSIVEIKYPDGSIERRVAEDTGGAIHGRILDVYVLTDHEAFERGREQVQLRIIN